MKRIFALVFLFLYFYNIAGYLAVFSIMQARVRSEVKKMLKTSVPESELVTFAFHTPSLQKGVYPLQWIEDHEFRYGGSMYDIVRSYTSSDTTYHVCINDVQEEQLFAHLDNHVQRHMGDSGLPGKLDSFKDVFKDSLTKWSVCVGFLLFEGMIVDLVTEEYLRFDEDAPFHPPRFLSYYIGS